MGILSAINLFRGCEPYMRGKVKEAINSSQWKLGERVVGMKINTEKAKEYLSKHPEDILNSGADTECITFIIRSGMTHYKCELMNTELLDDIQSALMVYK